MRSFTSGKGIRRHLVALSVLGVAALTVTPASSCTTVCLREKDRAVVAYNYDFHAPEGLVLVNKRGTRKVSSVRSQGATWTAVHGSVTFNQFGRDNPMTGLNEKGLMVSQMWLDETRYPPADGRPVVGILEWIQYQLDRHASVAEVVANVEAVRPMSRITIHYLVADASGDVATLEYLDGKLVVHRGATLPVRALTNSTYADSVAALERARRAGEVPTSVSSLDRFVRAATLAETGHGDPVARGFEVLARVAQPDFTRWSIVYDLGAGEVHFRTQGNQAIRRIALARLDFSCATPVRMLDVTAGTAGEVGPAFVDYSTIRMRALMEATFSKTPFLQSVPPDARDAVTAHPAPTASRSPSCAKRSPRRPPGGPAPRAAARPGAERPVGLLGIGLEITPGEAIRAEDTADVEGVRLQHDGGPRGVVRPPQRPVPEQERVQPAQEGVVVRRVLAGDARARHHPARAVGQAQTAFTLAEPAHLVEEHSRQEAPRVAVGRDVQRLPPAPVALDGVGGDLARGQRRHGLGLGAVGDLGRRHRRLPDGVRRAHARPGRRYRHGRYCSVRVSVSRMRNRRPVPAGGSGRGRRLRGGGASEPAEARLGLRDGHVAVYHAPRDLEHGIAVRGLVLEAPGEAPRLDVFEGGAEGAEHGLAVHLERAEDAAEHGGGPVISRRAEEAGLAAGAEDDLHLARHVHLHDQRLGGNARVAPDLECGHDGLAEHRPHALLHEEVERRLRLGGHLDRARAKDAQRLRKPQHPRLGPTAAIRFHTHAAPEALPGHEARARRHAGHAGREQQHVHGVRRVDEVEGQAVARAEGDGRARPQRGSDLALEDGGDDLIGQEHENDVGGGAHGDGNDLESVRPRVIRVFVFLVADVHLHPRIAEVEGGGASQVPIAKHRDRVSREGARRGIAAAVHLDLRLW